MASSPAPSEPAVHVIGDDPAVTHAVDELVRSFGHPIQSYAGPADFFRHFESAGLTPLGCVIFDLRMSGADGLEFMAQLTERHIPVSAICVTAYAETASTVKLMRAGALAVLDKPFRENELWSLIQESLAHAEDCLRRLRHHAELERRLRRLSPQDRQVLQLLLEGSKNRTMAKRLEVSLRTVENRRRRVFEVMQADSVAVLTRLVMEYEHGLPPAAANRARWEALPFEPVGS